MNIELLMDKILSGDASPEEQKSFESWLSKSNANREEFEDRKYLVENANQLEREGNDTFYDDLRKIQQQIQIRRHRKKLLRKIVITVGTALVLLALYFLFLQLGIITATTRTWSHE